MQKCLNCIYFEEENGFMLSFKRFVKVTLIKVEYAQYYMTG